MRDEDVPYAHVLALMERLGGDPATLALIKDGDHRLCRPTGPRTSVRGAGADDRSALTPSIYRETDPAVRRPSGQNLTFGSHAEAQIGLV